MIAMKNAKHIAVLAAFLFIETLPLYALNAALGPDGINAYPVHQQGVTGEGVNIALLSNGNVRDGHMAFERSTGSAVKLYDFTGTGLSRSAHDTHMAGIILSKGSSAHPDQIGAAPGARLHSGRFSNKNLYARTIAKALDELILKQHCRVIMTGIQLPKEIVIADGTSRWTKLYDYYAETYDVVIVSAAGNSSPSVTVFGDVYNGISTAGLVKSDPNSIYDKIGSASNRGPTADGRKKPEVAAPTQGLTLPTASGDDHWITVDGTGRGLTSYALPHTAGVAALLFEAAAINPTGNDDRTEVIKAVIVNTADASAINGSAGTAVSAADSISTWREDCGFGKLNAFKAYKVLTAGPIVLNTLVNKNCGWAYGIMDSNETHTYLIQAQKGQRLMATVTWHRKLKKAGNQYMEEPNRFYVNLKVQTPAGKMLGFETPGANNLIKTDYLLKEDGQYTIVLSNPTPAKDRDYGLAFELIDAKTASAN